jgi:hypothetical protein
LFPSFSDLSFNLAVYLLIVHSNDTKEPQNFHQYLNWAVFYKLIKTLPIFDIKIHHLIEVHYIDLTNLFNEIIDPLQVFWLEYFIIVWWFDNEAYKCFDQSSKICEIDKIVLPVDKLWWDIRERDEFSFDVIMGISDNLCLLLEDKVVKILTNYIKYFIPDG